MSGAGQDTKLLDHAWRHFEFHANQRHSLFNFCVLLFGLVVAAWSQVTTGDEPIPVAGVGLRILLTISSVVFWRMDQRNAYLTKMSEDVLAGAESTAFGGQAVLFNSQKADALIDKRGLLFIFGRQWSLGQSLRVLFFLMGMAGVLCAFLAWPWEG